MKKENGITLIALIITIIVMLILVGVTVNVAINGGLISTAQKAVSGMDMAQIQEKAEMVKVGLIADLERDNSGILAVKKEYMERLLSEFEGSRIEGNKIIIEDGKYEIVIDNTDLDIGVQEHSEELLLSITDIQRKNTEQDGKKYASTIWFDLEPNMTEEEYVNERNINNIDDKLKFVLEYRSLQCDQEFKTLDQMVTMELNWNYGGEYEEISEWQNDENLLAECGREEEFSKEHIYFYYYNWYIDESETMSAQELIETLFDESPIENMYSEMINIKDITASKGNETVKVTKSDDRVGISVFENGEYEVVARNYFDEEILKEKIIINDIETANNPTIVLANQDWKTGYVHDGSGYPIIATYLGTDTDVVVPLKVGDEKVYRMWSAFENNETIQKVIIPEGFESISNQAFENCSNLVYVQLPSTLNSLTCYFTNCVALTEITIPKSVKIVGARMFEGCTNLTNIYVEEGSSLTIPTETPWGAPNATVTVLPEEPTE